MIGEYQLSHLLCFHEVDIFIDNKKKQIFKTMLINIARIPVFSLAVKISTLVKKCGI